MDYLSFDLRLSDWNAAAKTGIVEVLQSPAGEGERYSFALQLDLEGLAQRGQRSSTAVVDLGRRLAASIFTGGTLELWNGSYRAACERNRGLRLRLNIDDWDLARLPWELLYNTRRDEFLVFEPKVSVVRYLRLPEAPPALRQSDVIKVLVVVASPQDVIALEWQREVAVLRQALQALVADGQVEFLTCEHATRQKLQEVLLDHRPDVVHYIGHGAYDVQQRVGTLLLEDEQGNSAPFDAPFVARLLRRYGVSLVVLNACETAQGAWAGLAPALVRAEIPAVVAMQWAVEDRAAIRFTQLFYRALARRKTIDECVAEGRVASEAVHADPNDWAAPVLFLRSQGGQLWTDQIARVRAPKDSAAPTSDPVARAPTPASATGPGTVPPVDAADQQQELVFKVRGPLLPATDSNLLVERPELRRALRLAQQPSVTQYVAFLGARQTGKTTLLVRLMDALAEHYPCVFIDLCVLRAQDARACFRLLAFELVSKLRATLGRGDLFPEVSHVGSAVGFLEFLSRFGDAVPVPRIIVLLDEVGALAPPVSDAFFNTLRTVFTSGRATDNRLSKYLFVFSGAVDLHSLTSGTNSPLNICERIYLGDLQLPDVHKIMGEFARLGVAVSPDAPMALHDLMGGHPYLVMRACSILERAGVREVTVDSIDMAAGQMLADDDNIQHLLRDLDAHPGERRRLRSILIEGKRIPFSRNDPVLASLEMIGAIRATQPCEIRNKLYERALRRYLGQPEVTLVRTEPADRFPLEDVVEATYSRLESLRLHALTNDGGYKEGEEWQSFAAALFSLVPAFSVYPDVHAAVNRLDVVLAVNPLAPGGDHWAGYQPAILVERHGQKELANDDILADLVRRAQQHGIRLVMLMASGEAPARADELRRASGCRDGVCVVQLRDTEIARLLAEHQDLDAYLRGRVLDARLHRI